MGKKHVNQDLEDYKRLFSYEAFESSRRKQTAWGCIDKLFNQYDREELIMDKQSLSVGQKDVNMNANQIAEMTQVQETITNQM